MSPRFRILGGLDSSTATPPQPTPDDDYENVNTEFIIFIGLAIILASLLCIIGLNAARCTWIRRFSDTVITGGIDHFSLPAAKLLRSIPKLTYSAESMAEKFSDCAICLAEFVVGEEIRVLPRCGHCFHVVCIDKWIGSHFTCPSCRQKLLKSTRCNLCADEVPVAGVTGIQFTTAGETSVTINRFLS
ncbi:Zinc finger, RING/FYVE/PHD-type [Cynara cardunculus var. scolymus]|uniref:Zinc finger, RING/FYVE/PHD-type n=1 Tax=Cynara cardunculus var. scolymus TaxID=59895 RepID=A0A124SGW6_CYNCS|nr:Zinc finger, RING/FYVE/PHD-type [Cynara cardunculus var. scolymus]